MDLTLYVAAGSLTRAAPQYEAANGEGVTLCRFDEASGTLETVGEPLRLEDSSWITASAEPDRFLVVTDCEDGRQSALATVALDRAGARMTLVDTCPAGGHEGCHAIAGRDGGAFVANYGGPRPDAPDAGLAMLGRGGPQFFAHEGSGPNPDRQEAPHAHCVALSPDGRFLFVADLGIDRLVAYAVTDTSLSRRADLDVIVAAGSGPRHLVFAADGTRAFVISELIGGVTTFSYDPATGAMTALATESLAHPSGREVQPAGLVAHPDGRHLFASVRLSEEIVVLARDDAGIARVSGRFPAGGTTPRDLTLSPDGRFLLVANQDSDRITVWPIEDGHPGAAPACTLDIGTPMAVAFI